MICSNFANPINCNDSLGYVSSKTNVMSPILRDHAKKIVCNKDIRIPISLFVDEQKQLQAAQPSPAALSPLFLKKKKKNH